MVATLHGSSLADMEASLQERKAAGANVVWAHLDEYWMDDGATQAGDSIARNNLMTLYQAAQNVGGIHIMPGPVGRKYWASNPPYGDPYWAAKWQWVQLVKDFINNPAQFKIDGKMVLSCWAYDDQGTGWTEADGSTRPSWFNQYGKPQLDSAGYVLNQDYMLWVHTFYPISADPGVNNISTLVPSTSSLSIIEARRPEISGIMEFAVGGWGSGSTPDEAADSVLNNLLTANGYMLDYKANSGSQWLIGYGLSALYHSNGAGDHDLGFARVAQLLDAVLSRPVDQRPDALVWTTGNDYAELSYVYEVPGYQGDGFTQYPSGFSFGPNIRRPLSDHSGVTKFAAPWHLAFINGNQSISITTDRLFCWYPPHPTNVSPRGVGDKPTELPADYAWSSSYYVNKPGWIDSIHNRGNTIQLAAHLTAPAQLRINGQVSQEFQPPIAVFEVPLDTFLGTPSFGLIRNGSEIMTASGPAPIVNDIWPGAGNPIISEVTP